MMENKNTDDKIDSIVKAFGKNAKSFSDILTQLLNRNVGENAFYLSDNGTADTLYICLKSSSDTYSWVTIATG